jgi:NurA domain
MLYRERLDKQLADKKSDFQDFERQQRNELAVYLEKLQRLEKVSVAEIVLKIGGNLESGSAPTFELDKHETLGIKFGETWNNHEESRSWAFEILKNRTTFAVDGSQIPPTRDISLTVAAVQIGWFENPHSENERYEKDVDFTILSPKDLMPNPAESRVSERRIQEEIRKTKEFLAKKKDWQNRGERMPLAFYDNTLLVPFPLSKEGKSKYIEEILSLVDFSKECEVPLVGYVARSFSRDLLTFLEVFDGEEIENSSIFDADILFPSVLKFWGDRTVFLISKRKGLHEFFGESVGFVYLQTTTNASPARIEIPTWIYEKGFLDEVLDVIRAECVVGLGYPYVLETADATAVITRSDQDNFYRILEEFSKENGINYMISRKAASKGRRR